MSRRAVSSLQKAAAAFRDLTPEEKNTFLLAVALGGSLEADAPTAAPRKRAAKAKEVPPSA